MKDRRDRLERALGVSQSLWRLHVTRLAQAEARVNTLRAAERHALDALERDSIDPRLTLTRLGQLSAARRDAEEAYALQIARARAYGRRARLTQRLFEKAEAIWRQDCATTQLRGLAGRADVSAP